MKIVEIGTGYTSIPAQMGAATEIVVEELTRGFLNIGQNTILVDIADKNRIENDLPITEVKIPAFLTKTDTALGIIHKLKRVVYSVMLATKIKTIVKEAEEDILLHFHNQYNLFFFLKLTPKKIRKKVRTAYTVHSYIWPDEWSKIEKTVRKKYFQEIFCVQNADYVLVLNDKTKEHFVNYLSVPKERIHKVKNGVNTDVYKPLKSEESNAVKKEISMENKHFIFQVGSVCERKNQFGAVQLMADYLKQNRNVAYVYAGGVIDAEYAKSISDFALENGISKQVIYVGELAPGTTLNKYYAAANATIFPSKLESFGLVIIESISAGTSVLIAEDILFQLGKGYTVYNDEKHFAKLLEKYMGSKIVDVDGREEVKRLYGWQHVVNEHLEIFRDKRKG